MHDLKSSDDVATLYEAVASLGPSTHILTSFWLLSTDKSISHVRNMLRARLNPQVDVSITELTQRHSSEVIARAQASQNSGSDCPLDFLCKEVSALQFTHGYETWSARKVLGVHKVSVLQGYG